MNIEDINTQENISTFKISLIPIAIGRLLPVIFLFVITILYSRKLSLSNYGQFQTIWLYKNVIGVILNFGITSILLSSNFNEFFNYLKSYKKYLITFYSLLFFIILSLFYFTTNTLTASIKFWLMLFIVAQLLGNIIDTLFIKFEQNSIFLVSNIVYAVVFFVIHVYFYFAIFNLTLLIICITILSLAKLLFVFLLRVKNKTIIYQNINVNNFTKDWFFIGLTLILGILASWLDKLFLQKLLTDEQFAIFFNGAIEIPLLGVLLGAAENVMLISIDKKKKNKLETINIFKESFKLLAIISFPLFFYFLCIHNEIYSIVFSNKYNESIPIFLVYIFLIPIRINHYGVILQTHGQAYKITLGAFYDILLSLLLMFILYPLLGTIGVALALVFSTYIQVFYYVWQSAKILKVGIFNMLPLKYLFKIFLFFGLGYLLLFFVKNNFSNNIIFISFTLFTIGIITVGVYFNWIKNKRLKFIY